MKNVYVCDSLRVVSRFRIGAFVSALWFALEPFESIIYLKFLP